MTDPDENFKETIRSLSDRLVEAQRPIRILDAIKWDNGVQEAFFAAKFAKQPEVDQEYYANRPLSFDPDDKKMEFHAIERDTVRRLGQYSPVGQILVRTCREYQMVVRMLEARGTAEFSSISQELYGSATDAFHAGDPTLADLGSMMSDTLNNIDRSLIFGAEEKDMDAETAVATMQDRLSVMFPGAGRTIRVVLDDGIIADAAAGSDYVKLRRDARFNERDLRLLEVHEGWVHVGTTLNGMNQPVCTFLSKGPPSSTLTQEGLALFMEIITFTSHPERLRRVTNRIQAVHRAEEGATFLDVFQFFREQGFCDADSYTNASRVFRGSTPQDGPFTKDLTYSKGFILVYNFIRLAVRKGKLHLIPLLFCGKATLQDIRTLAQLVEEGVVVPPRYLPPQFADLKALTAWMCYSNFLNRLNMQRIQADYDHLL